MPECTETLVRVLFHSVEQQDSAQRITNNLPNCCYFYCLNNSAEFGYPFCPATKQAKLGHTGDIQTVTDVTYQLKTI